MPDTKVKPDVVFLHHVLQNCGIKLGNAAFVKTGKAAGSDPLLHEELVAKSFGREHLQFGRRLEANVGFDRLSKAMSQLVVDVFSFVSVFFLNPGQLKFFRDSKVFVQHLVASYKVGRNLRMSECTDS